MERRWLLFLLLTFLVIWMFSILNRPMQQQPETETILMEGEERPTSPTLIAATPQPRMGEEEELAWEQIEEQQLIGPADIAQRFKTVTVRNDFYEIVFSSQGARPISWKIIDPRFVMEADQKTSQPMQLIPQIEASQYREFPLEVELRLYGGPNLDIFNRGQYSVSKVEDRDKITLTFVSPEVEDKLRLTKQFIIARQGYPLSLKMELSNEGQLRYKFDYDGKGLGIIWGAGIGDYQGLEAANYRYIQGVFLTESKLKTVHPRKDRVTNYEGKVYWAGQQTKFFLAAVVPTKEPASACSAQVRIRNLNPALQNTKLPQPLTMTMYYPRFYLEPGQTKKFDFLVYVGPKHYDILSSIDYNLKRAVFSGTYGWLRPFCIILLKVLRWLYSFAGNYGIAILLLTLLIKFITYPLMHKASISQARLMAKQRQLKPEVDKINEKYKDNPQLKTKKVWELYKKHNINPLGMLRGCFPMLIQMPIFIAFYFLLLQAIELRAQPFLWIKDLSAPDALFKFATPLPLIGTNFNLLPLIMGATQLVISLLSPSGTGEASQKQMMIIFPLFMLFIFYNFPSGLILYWVASNITQLVQQLVTNRIVKKEMEGHT